MAAIAVTGLIHVAVGAVVMIGWPHSRERTGQRHLVSVVILPRAADEPRERPDAGARVEGHTPELLPAPSSLPPALLPAPPPPPLAMETVAALPAPAEGGRGDSLAMATQAYRRAIMAKLEEQRQKLGRDLPTAHVGRGEVLFRIERGGGLADVSLVRPTGRKVLDRAALAIVKGAAPFPVIPDALPDELAITLPVEFLVADADWDLAR